MAEATAKAFPGAQITASDIDPAMVNVAARRLQGAANAEARQADVTALPFGSATLDVVACYLMLHHVIDWRQAVSESARVLKPGGTFVGYDLARTRVASWIHVLDRSPHALIADD